MITTQKPRRSRTSIRAMLTACIPMAVRATDPVAPAPSPDMHLHVAAIAGCLKRTAARTITFQAGSIIVEARRVALILIALTALVRATDPVAPQTDPVAPQPDIIKSGSFLTCPRTGSDLIIEWDSSAVRATDPVAPVETHGRASLPADCSATITVKSGPAAPDRQLWDIPEATGIILNWDCDNNRLYVTDPNNYLTGHALWYTVKIWRAK